MCADLKGSNNCPSAIYFYLLSLYHFYFAIGALTYFKYAVFEEMSLY
jgi:hypothetical protein